MRHCTNETNDVFEAEHNDLAVALRDVADTLDANEHTWANLTVGNFLDDEDEGKFKYRVTLYVH